MSVRMPSSEKHSRMLRTNAVIAINAIPTLASSRIASRNQSKSCCCNCTQLLKYWMSDCGDSGLKPCIRGERPRLRRNSTYTASTNWYVSPVSLLRAISFSSESEVSQSWKIRLYCTSIPRKASSKGLSSPISFSHARTTTSACSIMHSPSARSTVFICSSRVCATKSPP